MLHRISSLNGPPAHNLEMKQATPAANHPRERHDLRPARPGTRLAPLHKFFFAIDSSDVAIKNVLGVTKAPSLARQPRTPRVPRPPAGRTRARCPSYPGQPSHTPASQANIDAFILRAHVYQGGSRLRRIASHRACVLAPGRLTAISPVRLGAPLLLHQARLRYVQPRQQPSTSSKRRQRRQDGGFQPASLNLTSPRRIWQLNSSNSPV
jgi:hypothetical protein